MNFYNNDIQNVLQYLETSEKGLSSSQAANRLLQNGKNKLIQAKRDSTFKRFIKQLSEPMTIILIVAAIISATMELYNANIQGHFEFPIDVIIILAVVLINAVLGVLQESKAEKAIDALQEISGATSKVLRDERIITIKSEYLVCGDIIILEAGDSIPADARIIECASIKTEESALTGESLPISKTSEIIKGDNITLGDRTNMVYMGSTVVYGRAKAVITQTGMNTEMGKIAKAITQADKGKTPLQIKLSQLSKTLTILVIAISTIVFVINIVRELIITGNFSLDRTINFFMIAISLAVAAIPEGLSTVVTIVLSIGVTNMSKQNAIIRKLTAVETLGCTQIICSDKTGTLTQNKMTVVDCYSSNQKFLANAMSLCSDAELDIKEKKAVGEPTECALVNYAHSLNLDKNEQKNIYQRIGEIPFDSSRKMMTTIHKTPDGKIVQFTKGAPDEILKRCSFHFKNEDQLPINDIIIEEILKANKSMANKALRVLACAYRVLDNIPEEYTTSSLEENMCFIGLVGMIDPVREEVKPAIDQCRHAGIRPIMITGDHKDTAIAIANELGIIKSSKEAITGAELDKINENDFIKQVEDFSVYARVQPEHKTRIVNAWKNKGKITAMTGDGVNDAPSIKKADIGIGMGITGTDVTKNVADMILADDNFATIVSAVDEGRKVYSNIRKSIQFLLSSNLSEVLGVFIATLMGFTLLKPIHMLWINLITDSLPALALGMEPKEDDAMNKAPRDPKEGLFSNGVGIDIFYQGLLVAVLTIIAYLIGRQMESSLDEELAAKAGMTMAFLTMSMAEIFHSFNVRNQKKSIFIIKKQNLYLWGAGIIALLLTTAVIEIKFLANLFDFTQINLKEYLIAMGLAISIIPLVEIGKLISRTLDKMKTKNR